MVHVEYSSRAEFGSSKPLLIEVRNESASPVESLAVEIDRSYLEGFQPQSFVPEPKEVTTLAHVIDLGDVQPGEVRRVAVDLTAEKVGQRAGQVRVTSRDHPVAAIDISTFVFP